MEKKFVRIRKDFKGAKYQAGVVLLTDLIMWGAIVLVATAFVFGLNKVAVPAYKGWTEGTAVVSHIKNISNIYNGAATYNGLSNATVSGQNDDIFDAKYLPGGNVITNQFNGNVTLGTGLNLVADDTITYTDSNIPSAACKVMVNQVAADVDRVTVAGTVVKAPNAPVQSNTLNTQCKSANVVSILVEKFKNS